MRSDKICLDTCLWSLPETYRHRKLRVSSAQFDIVMAYLYSLGTDCNLFYTDNVAEVEVDLIRVEIDLF